MEIHDTMITHTFALLAWLVTLPAPITPGHAPAHVVAVGGPPAIRIANKAFGDITAAVWNSVRDVELVGCVHGAYITDLRIRIKDCSGKFAGYRTNSHVVSESMHTMVRNLPPDTPFYIIVVATDPKGTVWEVPPARFVWKG